VETFRLIFQKFATFLTTDTAQQKFRIFSIKNQITADFVYSPQRYDEEKTEKAILEAPLA
jgi:hypothetical protein